GLFWILHRLCGDAGYPLAQILSWAIFYVAMLLLARLAIPPFRGARLHFVSALAAFTPIMTHVASRYWLDAPQLAFATLAAALFLLALARRSPGWAVGAALAFGYASWIKSSAFVTLPGVLLLGWAVSAPEERPGTLRLAALFAGLAA